MNRKLRLSPKSSANRPKSFHKFLKPGALAQLRDSQIVAKSCQFDLLAQIYLRRTSAPESSPVFISDQPEIEMAGDFPALAGRVFGPLCLKRKKLAAIKSTWFPSPDLQSSASDLVRDPIVDVFSSNVAAH